MTRLSLLVFGVVLLASSSIARSEPVAAQVQLLPPAGTQVEVQPVGRYYGRYYARPYARYYAPRAYYYAPRPRYYANYYAVPYYSAPYYDGYYGPRAYYRSRWAYRPGYVW